METVKTEEGQLEKVLAVCEALDAEIRYHQKGRYFTAMVWNGRGLPCGEQAALAMWMMPIIATPAGLSAPSAEPLFSTKRTLLLTMRATRSFYVTTAMRKRLCIVRSAGSMESAKIWRLSGSAHGRMFWPTPHNGGKL